MTLKLNGSSSGYTALDAPAAAGSNTLTLPTTNGTAGQVLQTDGNGNLSWVTITPGKLLKTAYKTTTTTGQVTVSSSDWSEVDTNARLSYTPASATSTIWIFTQYSAKVDHGHKFSVLCGVDNGSTIKCINEGGSSDYDETFSGTDPAGFNEMLRSDTGAGKFMFPANIVGHFISEGTSALTLKLMGKSSNSTSCKLNDVGLCSSFYVMEMSS